VCRGSPKRVYDLLTREKLRLTIKINNNYYTLRRSSTPN